ncbi:MAG: hypothetical protein U9Q82_01460 [Chloroflexota bacterium]|nr:hypothetical protein [Chloroflexota bacterium]
MKTRIINTNNHSDVRQFIRFPFELYANNPYWVPTMRSEMKAALNQNKHPFYQHSEAAFFLAERGDETVGRIAMLNNRRYREQTQSPTGLFYFFEVIDDLEVARALFETGFNWVSKRGINTLVGPKGLAQGDGLGMLVEGFDHLPAMGIPYNHDYYPGFMDELGFEKDTDLLSGYASADEREFKMPERVHKLAERVKNRRGLHVKKFATKQELREWIPNVREVYNRAFGEVPEFVPISEDEIWIIADRILSIADPRLIKLIFKGEELIGFLFAYPNISRGLQKARGRMLPFGWFHIMREFKRTRILDINGIGLMPGHQGVGATAVLYAELDKTVREFDFNYANIVQINETNLKSYTEMDHLGVKWHKRHRIYKRAFE